MAVSAFERQVELTASATAQARPKYRKASSRRLVSTRCPRSQPALELGNLLSDRHLGRNVTRILQHPIGQPKLLGDIQIIVEMDRFPRAAEPVEITAGNRLGDALLRDIVSP